MIENNKKVIENIYAAFNSRNYEGVLSHFTDDFEWQAADNSPLADQSPYHGIEAIREGVFARIAAGFEKLEVEIDEIFEGDGRVVVLGYYHGKFHGNANESKTQLAHIWTVRDGKATKFQQYIDTLAIFRSVSELSSAA